MNETVNWLTRRKYLANFDSGQSSLPGWHVQSRVLVSDVVPEIIEVVEGQERFIRLHSFASLAITLFKSVGISWALTRT
jgi:hypothetical protein